MASNTFNKMLSMAEINNGYKTNTTYGTMCFMFSGDINLTLLSTEQLDIVQTENEKAVSING